MPGKQGKAKIAREPIVVLGSGQTVAEEILCRENPFPKNVEDWRRFYRKLLSGLADPVGDTIAAFNLDTRHVLDQQILRDVERFLGKRDASQWAIEWTEHEAGDHALAAKKLRALRQAYGVGISIDDIGAGVDGFHRMHAVECANWLKIDGPLFQSARTGAEEACRIVEKICRTAKDQEARSVVEWIETDADLELAKRFGADCGQGYHFTFPPAGKTRPRAWYPASADA